MYVSVKKRDRKPTETTCFIPRRHKELMTCGDIFGISFPVIICYGRGKETEICSSTILLYKCCCAKISLKKVTLGGYMDIGRALHTHISAYMITVHHSALCSTLLLYTYYILHIHMWIYVHIMCGRLSLVYIPLPIHLCGPSMKRIYISFQRALFLFSHWGSFTRVWFNYSSVHNRRKTFSWWMVCLNRLQSQIIQFLLIWLISYQGGKKS